MNKEQIIDILAKMLENPKSKTFLNHLIKSYVPATNIIKVEKTGLVCVLTKEQSNEGNVFVTGKDTTTHMSDTAIQIFTEWVTTKAAQGDKHINWVLGSIRRSAFIERSKNSVPKLKKENRATFSLGDSNNILGQLKAKMVQQEK